MFDITNFHFLRPYWLIALVPLVILVWLMLNRHRLSGTWQSVCDSRLLPHILMGARQEKRFWPVFIMGLAGLLAIIALAGPTWQQLPQPVFRTQSSLVIVLDLSRSMDAGDIKPSRLVRARHKIQDILQQRKEGQTALIVYAMEPFTVTPLTQDTNTIAELVKSLSTDIMTNQGSRTGVAIRQAADLLQQAGAQNGHVLLITDGIDDNDAANAIQSLRNKGHRLSILGIGTEVGAPIPTASGGFLTDSNANDEIVISKMDDAHLRELARTGGGRFALMTSNDADINRLNLTVRATKLENKQQDSDTLNVKTDLWREEGPWLLLLVLPLAILVFRRGILSLFIIVLLPMPQTSHAFEWRDLWQTRDQQAAEAFEKGESQTAAGLFEDPQWKAAAHYKAKNYENAVKALKGANTPDALYNKANAVAHMGNIEEAIKTYDEALALDPDHEDAKYNRDLLQQILQDQRQQSKNQQQQDQDNGDSDQQQSQQNDQQENKEKGGQDQTASNEQDDKQGDSEKQDSQRGEDQAQKDRQQQAATADENKQQQQDKDKSLAQQKQGEDNNDENADEKRPRASINNEMDMKQQEKQLANKQWLKQIPDDPGGLLRRKFQYQSQLNSRKGVKDDKPW